MLAVFALHTVAKVGPSQSFWDNVYTLIELGAVYLCLRRAVNIRQERAAWLILALGLLSSALGDIYVGIYYPHATSIPIPSIADVLYLAFYPAAFVALALLARARAARMTRGLWLEALIAFFTVAAYSVAFLQKPLQEATGGSPVTVAVSLAFPLFDVMLLSFVVGVGVATGMATGRRASRTWLLLAAGFVVFSVADAIYAYQNAATTYEAGTLLDIGWPLAFTLLAFAAWQPGAAAAEGRTDARESVVLPNLFGLLGLALLTYAAFAGDVLPAAIALAASSLAIVVARMGLMVTERIRSGRQLGASEERYRALVRSLPDTVIALFDQKLALTFVDGASRDDVEALRSDAEQARALERGLAGQYTTYEFSPAKGRTWSVDAGPYRPGGIDIEGVFTVARDITRHKEIEEELAYRAMHDALTGIPNRLLFMDRLEHALARLRREETEVAVFFVDLDRFKLLNDSLGHAAGDKALVNAAEQLTAAVRPSDTVARLGGDEFAVLVETIDDETDLSELASRLAEAVRLPFEADGEQTGLTASIGIIRTSDPSASPSSLLRDADTAMYRAKQSGRANWKFFNGAGAPRATRR